jgi:hypothetical protein
LEPDAKDEAKTLLADETQDVGSESDDTSAGGTEYRSSEAESSGLSDSESTQNQPSRLVLSDLVSDVSVLKAQSPMFVPMLDASLASTLPAFTTQPQQTPLRAKLRSKAAAFTPFSNTGEYNAEAVEGWDESWQQWSPEESYNYYDSYGANEDYTGYYDEGTYTEGYEGFSEQDGTTSWESSVEATSEAARLFAQI